MITSSVRVINEWPFSINFRISNLILKQINVENIRQWSGVGFRTYDASVSPPIDNANNLVFWCRFLNKLEPWYAVYIMQQ